MFRCQKCGSRSAPRVSPKLIVLETRPQTYVNYRKRDIRDRDFEEVVTSGWEIVKEMKVCDKPECSAKEVNVGALSAKTR